MANPIKVYAPAELKKMATEDAKKSNTSRNEVVLVALRQFFSLKSQVRMLALRNCEKSKGRPLL